MPLEPGRTLGTNEVIALKILPDAFAADPDRLARFQREAQVLVLDWFEELEARAPVP